MQTIAVYYSCYQHKYVEVGTTNTNQAPRLVKEITNDDYSLLTEGLRMPFVSAENKAEKGAWNG